jgi:catecholate siderophore receptor
MGVYVQDLVQIAPMWKLLAGLRWDRFQGDYLAVLAQGNPNQTVNGQTTPNPCYVPAGSRLSRNDSLASHRLGLLFQPSDSQSYHLSYGTSFNTSGDAYQYDPGTSRTPAEKSRNIELGAKLDWANGRVSTRAALFHSTKYNERNRDADSVDGCNYVLVRRAPLGGRGVRRGRTNHPGLGGVCQLLRLDSQTAKRRPVQWFAAGTEAEGSRPGLTPRKLSGTLWTTYQLTPRLRVGGGLNGKLRRPAGRPVGHLAV